MKPILVPIVPTRTICDFWHWSYETVKEAAIHYLQRACAPLESVMVLEHDTEFIERVQGDTGKQVIPGFFLTGNRQPPFVLEPKELAYAEWLEARRDQFPRVIVGNNSKLESGGDTPDVLAICRLYQSLFGMLPWAQDRFGFSPFCADVIRCLRDNRSHDTFVDFLERARPLMLLFIGFWAMEHMPNRGEYLQAYLRQARIATVITGINFATGAKDHNLLKMSNWGYDGCLFLLPTTICPESDRMMEDYLTDIEVPT